MAKRGLVGRMFFVYDHTALQKEEDDLKDAIVYFYPPNVPEDDQCALCGQLMGMVSFFQATWSAKPSVYQLASHKFVLKHVEEKYTLALGGERSVSEHCLERQLHLLYSTFSMYKGSLRAIRQNCESRGVSFYETVAPIWECFLPFCCAYGDDVRRGFLSLPTVELPKSGADIFLQASAMLQASKRRPGVLGGAVLSSNSVLCTQLSEDLTSRILVIKPQQAHLPCEPVLTDFPLPVGVRIISVYISHSDYAKLSPRGNQSQQMHTRMSRFKPGRGSALSEEPPPYNFVVASSKSQFSQPQNHDEDFSEFAQNESSVNVCIGSVPSLGCQSDVAMDRSNHADSHEHSDSHGNQGMPKSSFSDNVNSLKERTTERAKSDQPADPLSSDSDSNERQNSLGQKSNNSSTTHCIAADVHFDGTSFDDAKSLVSNTSINETCYISQSIQEESEENKAATFEPQSQSDKSSLNLCSAKSQTFPESEMVDTMVTPDSEENSPESHDNGTVPDQLHEADSENVNSDATVSENLQNVKDNKSSSKIESCEDETLRQERDLSQLDGLNDEIQTEKSGEIDEAVSVPKSIYERGESKLNSLSGECLVKSNENNGESVDGTDCLTHDLDVTAGSESRTQGSTKNSKNSGAMEIVEKTNSAENKLPAEETDIHADCSVDETVHTVSEKEESEMNNYLNKEVVLSERQPCKSDTDVIDSVLCAFPHNQTSHESAQTVSMSHSECNVHIPMQSDTEGLMTDEQHRTTQGRNGYCVEKHDSKEDENLNSNVSSLVTNSADSAISVSEILVSDDFDHVNKAGFGALTPPGSAADKRLLSSTDTSSAQDENKETFVFAVDQSVSSEAQDSVPGMRLLKPSMKLNTLASVSPIPTSVGAPESNTQISHVPHSTFKGLQQEAVNVTLYIQGHSDSMLILFMEEQSRHDKETVQALWKLALPQLGDLDYRVKEFIKEEIPRPAHEDYYYLKFNDFQRQVSGNVTKPVTSGECEFCDLSVDMHEEFRKSPSVTDLCIRTHRASVYGHRSVNHEVFFQSVSKHHQTNGLPFAKDALFSLDQISQRKLYKNHNITFV